MPKPKNQNLHEEITTPRAKNYPAPQEGSYIVWDKKQSQLGLGLRVYASGSKSWIVGWKFDNQTLKPTLGPLAALDYKAAVSAARKFHETYPRGSNPIELRRQAAAAEKVKESLKGLTVLKAVDSYIAAKQKELKPSSMRALTDLRASIERAPISRVSLIALSGADLDAEYKRILRNAKKGSGETSAAIALRNLRAACNHTAVSKKVSLATPNPWKELSQLRRGWNASRTRSRTVVETDSQIRLWWEAVESLRTDKVANGSGAIVIADYLQISLLTGCRKSELLGLKWSDVDFTMKSITLTNTKNSTTHIIPFGPFVEALLRKRKKLAPRTKAPTYVFPSTRPCRDGHFKHIQEPKKQLANVTSKTGIQFSAHDLRRSFASMLDDVGFDIRAIQKALNHTPAQVADRHYIVHRLDTFRKTFEGLEEAILVRAGVVSSTPTKVAGKPAEAPSQPIRLKKLPSGAYLATCDGYEGEGANPDEAKEMLAILMAG